MNSTISYDRKQKAYAYILNNELIRYYDTKHDAQVAQITTEHPEVMDILKKMKKRAPHIPGQLLLKAAYLYIGDHVVTFGVPGHNHYNVHSQAPSNNGYKRVTYNVDIAQRTCTCPAWGFGRGTVKIKSKNGSRELSYCKHILACIIDDIITRRQAKQHRPSIHQQTQLLHAKLNVARAGLPILM